LIALNEVGGDPGEFGRSVDEWHDYCRRLANDWPTTMTTLSTHDTKRTEDVRARLLVLAEIPAEWEQAVTSWRERAPGVDANTDYLFWQTLVGAWPIEVERMHGYLEKATREAKEKTSWTEPDEAFEQALHAFIDTVYADVALMHDIGDWVQEHLVDAGHTNSLAQKLLQLTMPGVPDVYQGQELVGLALVDPDNRRPVDYDERRRALDAFGNDVDAVDRKLLVTATALRLRRQQPSAFTGSYSPLPAIGAAADHVVAFARGDDVVTVVTRLPVTLQRTGGWHDAAIALPDGNWRDTLTGERVESTAVESILRRLPVALLVRDREDTQ
jgi:(1->4)-alpha-D-glucan 1-alpha-D-glucosylmutase